MLLPKNRIIWAIKTIIKSIKFQSKTGLLVNFKNEIINILKKNSNILLKRNARPRLNRLHSKTKKLKPHKLF